MRLLAILALASLTIAGDRKPSPRVPRAKYFDWKTRDGLKYSYYIPKDYRHGRGANLVLALTPVRTRDVAYMNWSSARAPGFITVGVRKTVRLKFNIKDPDDDVGRLNALIREIKSVFKINAVYLFGDRYGAALALHYASRHPTEVQGVVAMQGRKLSQTKTPINGPALAFVHNIVGDSRWVQDPPAASVSGTLAAYEALFDSTGPKRLFIDHIADEVDKLALSALAWCEGVTSDSKDRVLAAFARLRRRPQYGALYQVTARRTKSKKRDRALRELRELAESHVKTILTSLGGEDGTGFLLSPWVGHIPLFLASCRGIPACNDFARQWDARVKKQTAAATPHLARFRTELKKDMDAALAAGLKAIQTGFLLPEVAERHFLSEMQMLVRALAHKPATAGPSRAFKDFQRAWSAGRSAYVKVNRSYKPPR